MGGERGDAKRDLLDLDDPDGLDGGSVVPSSSRTISTVSPVSHETVRPPFDLARYAEDSDIREKATTITDEVATEEARIASVLMDSTPPRARTASAPEVAFGIGELEALSTDEQIAVLYDKVSPLERVPNLTRPLTQLGGLIEDPKTAYVLGFVDGLLPLETILEIAGLPEIDTLRILDRAITQQVIEFKKRPRR